jgi:hypothetical protein
MAVAITGATWVVTARLATAREGRLTPQRQAIAPSLIQTVRSVPQGLVRVDSREALLKGGKSGPDSQRALKPGAARLPG